MTTSTSTLDHDKSAATLDHAYLTLANLDRSLAAAGLRSWQPPRSHLLAAHAELHHLRHALDQVAMTAGIASPYVLRAVAAPLAPEAPAGDSTGPHLTQPPTGDDDRRAYPHNGLALGASSAIPGAPASRAAASMPDHRPDHDALTSPPARSDAVYPDQAV